jgi:hypothetical protein
MVIKVNSTVIFLFAIGVGLVATIVTTIYTEYIPKNDIATKFDTPDYSFIVKRESTMLIPLKNAFIPRVSDLSVTIHQRQAGNEINSVKLYTTADSILSYYGDFKLDQKTKDSLLVYKMNVSAQHNLQVQNSTNIYRIATYYINTSGALKQAVIPFSWPIKTLDFSLLTYFWLVLIGVIVSRFTSRYIEETNHASHDAASNKSIKSIEFQTQDYLWIAFSGIIALLIFSEFQKNVQLTSNIITNISLAFGFGFGFDRILDVGQKLQKKK